MERRDVQHRQRRLERTLAAMLSTQSAIDESCVNCLTAGSGPISKALSWGLGWGLERTARGQAFYHWGENNGEIHNLVMPIAQQLNESLRHNVELHPDSFNAHDSLGEAEGLSKLAAP